MRRAPGMQKDADACARTRPPWKLAFSSSFHPRNILVCENFFISILQEGNRGSERLKNPGT